jgi:hypothetical protein
MLNKINTLPVTEWDYKTEGPTVKHIGPVAQDFYAAFGVGNNNTSISTIDPAGIALLGIQALSKQIQNIQGAFSGNIDANGPLTVVRPVLLQSTLIVLKPVTFSGDTVGEAEIKAGVTSVHVSFSEQYQYQPIITTTPLEFVPTAYRVTDINGAGFSLEIESPLGTDVTFDWHAFGAEGAKLTVSDGTSQAITLVLPPSASAGNPPTSETSNANAEPAPGNHTDSVGAETPTNSQDTMTTSELISASVTTPTQSGSTSPSATDSTSQSNSSGSSTTSGSDAPTSSATAASPQGQAVNAVQ